MKELLKKTWDKVRDVLILVIELPVMLIAVIAAGLLHDAVYILEEIDPLDAEFEELEEPRK